MKYYNRVKFTTSTTGTGAVTVGSAVSMFRTPAQAGIPTGTPLRYLIEEGTEWELGWGVYTVSGTTLSRNARQSSNSDALITLAGAATVRILPTSEDFHGISFDPDQPPGTADAMDDEFEGGSLDGKWTESKSSSTNSVYSIEGTKLIVRDTTGNTQSKYHHDFYQTAPAGTWRFRAKFHFEGPFYNYLALGMRIKDNTSGRDLFYALISHSSYVSTGGLALWNIVLNGESSVAEAAAWGYQMAPFYMEIEKTNSTTVQGRLSKSGHDGTFINMFAAKTLAGMGMTAFDKVGLGFMPYTTAAVPYAFSCDWFRRMA